MNRRDFLGYSGIGLLTLTNLALCGKIIYRNIYLSEKRLGPKMAGRVKETLSQEQTPQESPIYLPMDEIFSVRVQNGRGDFRTVRVNFKEMVSQMIISGVDKKDSSNILEPHLTTKNVLREFKPGGIIYMGTEDDIRQKSRNEIGKLSGYFQSLSKIPLFIATDCEGGLVNRLDHIYKFPSAEYFGRKYLKIRDKKGYLQEVRNWSRTFHKVMGRCGINMNLGPCLDTVESFNNDLGCIEKFNRSFGTDPQVVAELGCNFIKSAKNGKKKRPFYLATVGKHFVGEGMSRREDNPALRGNSHECIAILPEKKQFQTNLIPFQSAMLNTQMDSVMMGYVKTPYDPTCPAVFSGKTIELLRNRYNFRGIIMSDDLLMLTRVNQDETALGDYVVKAVNAGINSFITISPGYIPQIVASIMDGVKRGLIPPRRIIESFNYIIEVKNKIRIG